MTKDRPTIFQNRRTLQERNQIRKTMVAHILKSEFKKEFKTCRILIGDRFFNVDLMSEDNEIAVKIINPHRATLKKLVPENSNICCLQYWFLVQLILKKKY